MAVDKELAAVVDGERIVNLVDLGIEQSIVVVLVVVGTVAGILHAVGIVVVGYNSLDTDSEPSK